VPGRLPRAGQAQVPRARLTTLSQSPGCSAWCQSPRLAPHAPPTCHAALQRLRPLPVQQLSLWRRVAASHARHAPAAPRPAPPRRQPNPFVLPADADIFRVREQQRAERAAERQEMAGMSVRDKSTTASRHGATFGDPAVRAQFSQVPATCSQLPCSCLAWPEPAISRQSTGCPPPPPPSAPVDPTRDSASPYRRPLQLMRSTRKGGPLGPGGDGGAGASFTLPPSSRTGQSGGTPLGIHGLAAMWWGWDTAQQQGLSG